MKTISILSRVICIFFCSIEAIAAPPTLRIVSPYSNARDNAWVVRREISFTVDAKDDQAIDRIEFYVDNKLVATDQTYPYSWMWNTQNYSVGNHTIKAIAFDTQGQSTTVQRSVKVNAPGIPKTTDNSVVTKGLLPKISPTMDVLGRDVSATKGGDGYFYMVYTGASNDAWFHNEGVNLWRSADLKKWEYVGLVWSFLRDGTPDDTLWRTDSKGAFRRVIWAPEIMYFNKTYYITASIPAKGTYLFKSTSGKPEGPYVNNNPTPNATLFGNIDGMVFMDTDATPYLCYENGAIAKLNTTLTGRVGTTYYLGQGDEGGFLFKVKNKYYLSVAKFMDNGRYSSYVGISDSPTGPYSQWHEALPCGGHNSYFFDNQGVLWGTFFGNDSQAPWREKPAIVKMKFNTDGTLMPDPNQGIVTGIEVEDTESGQVLGAFPNPFSDEIQLKSTGDFEYTILDMSGTMVEKGDGNTSIYAGRSLAPGIYLVKIQDQQGSAFLKVCKK